MRLNRLDLIRYGRFDGAEIRFPRHTDGTRDVTVIYGPNEAGKSTAFSGYLELLFGMKVQHHPYAFRYERNDLLVGAELDLPGRGAMVLRRNGKRNQSLVDEQGRPVQEAILTGALHGLDRDAYVERFSLNDASLRDGGTRIAGAQGDLGQLLHAGVSGLTSLSEVLNTMSERADAFHKKGGRGTALKKGKERLNVIGRELRAGRLTPERERKLAADRAAAQAAFAAADQALGRARAREVAAQAAQTWVARSADIARIDQRLAACADGPDLPEGTAAQVAELLATLDQTVARIAEAEARIAQCDQIIAENPEDPQAGDLARELAGLEDSRIDGASLTSRADTARSDLVRRIEEREAKARQMDGVLAELGLPQAKVGDLLLPPEDLEALASAVQTCLSAEQECKAARTALHSGEAQRGAAPARPQDMTHLQGAWETWQAVSDLSLATANLQAAQARLDKAVVGLPQDWVGLLGDGLPLRETLEDFARDWAALNADLRAAEEVLAERAAECAMAKSQREAEEAAPMAVDAAQIEASRRNRDAAWAAHRASLSAESADAFEARMYADDGARANFLAGAEARQQLAAARRTEMAALASHRMARDRLESLRERHRTQTARAAGFATALGLAPDSAPAGFVGRLAALQEAGALAAEVKSAASALEQARKQRAAALLALRCAARDVAIEGADEAIPAKVSAALVLQESRQKVWDKWCADGQTLAALGTALEAAEAAQSQAVAELAARSRALPLPDLSAPAIRDALPALRRLQKFAEDHRQLCTRVAAMEQAVGKLEAIARRLARILNEPFEAGGDLLVLIERAKHRVGVAERAEQLREAETRRRMAELEAVARAKAARDGAQSALAACFTGQGGSDLAPRARVAHLEERDALRRQRTTAEREREAARDAVDSEIFAEELAHLPNAARAGDVQQALADAQSTRDHARDEMVEAERLYRAAFAADASDDLATEQATILEDLRDGARQAAVSRLGVLAARAALRRLAGERRSTMLQDVEEAFVAMTAPAWSRVDVWSEAEGEKLVGVQPDGSTVPVASMSTGTMGQLYFALRLAGYRSFARDPGPLPMILDDIMETFDDARATAALRLCAEIGASGQAIIFTHHAHLVDLARSSIPGVAVVEMPH